MLTVKPSTAHLVIAFQNHKVLGLDGFLEPVRLNRAKSSRETQNLAKNI
jgi:hypothetical protein